MYQHEVAANEGTFEKEKIFEIYMSIPFNINQLINASTIYQGLEGYEGRALIYQRSLLSDDVENKLKLLMLLKDLFEKDKLSNVYTKDKNGHERDESENFEKEEVTNPKHYDKVGFVIQPIEYITANELDFLEGNVIKYVSRYEHKGGVNDLLKARQYINWLITRERGKE